MDDTLAFTPVAELAGLLRRREVSPLELTQLFLDRIAQYDERLTAFSVVCADRALAAARAAEAAMDGGQHLGLLHGMPLAIKDLFDVAGLPTTGGSVVLRDNVPERDACVAHRLAAAGSCLLGKTHMVEFAFGGTGINHHYGTPWNPWDAGVHRLPGGSSSGSAVAVAAGMAPVALGTDTGGSVRIPASFCGLVGLKPTFGRVSNAGVLQLDPNLDSVGPLARTVADAAAVLAILAGPDTSDPDTWARPLLPALDDLHEDIAGTRVCFPREYFWDEVDEEVEAAVRASAQVFADLDAHVGEASLMVLNDLAELRPGLSLTAVETCLEYGAFLEDRVQELDPVVAPRMLAGREVRAVDFLRQQRALEGLQHQAAQAFQDVDVLVTPTTLFAAPPVDEVDQQGRYFPVNSLCLRNTAAANLLGLCAVSLPCGLTREGLPIGLQLIAGPFDEARLLRVAYAFEQASGWGNRQPDMERF